MSFKTNTLHYLHSKLIALKEMLSEDSLCLKRAPLCFNRTFSLLKHCQITEFTIRGSSIEHNAISWLLPFKRASLPLKIPSLSPKSTFLSSKTPSDSVIYNFTIRTYSFIRNAQKGIFDFQKGFYIF